MHRSPLQPRIVMLNKQGEEIASYYLPGNAYLNVEDGTEVKAGRTLAKMLKESAKTQDITGGPSPGWRAFRSQKAQRGNCYVPHRRNCKV